jgi:hypothetical protein
MRVTVYMLSVMLMPAAVGLCRAAGSDLAGENAELRQRVERLEKELAEIKRLLAQQAPAQRSEVKPSEVAQRGEQRKIAEAAPAAPLKKPVWSNLDIQLYGYLKLDAAYDSSRIDDGNFAKWVDPENERDNDNQFNMTANQSRFGVQINGPDDEPVKASGRAEVDFYGGGSENKSHLMMRHAYMKLDWPEDRFTIIAGQTSDVISPLYPSTVNYSVGWWTGNIGYRRPQLRLTKQLALGCDTDLKLEGALARTIGRDNMLTPKSESGEDAGFPSFQARASVTLPLFGAQKTTVGVSGHWGEEEYDIAGGEKDFQTWSLNLDLTQPVNEWLSIKGELFTGENLSAYLGGVGQGVITDTSKPNFYKEIGSSGGWIAAALGPWDKVRFNIGTGMDDVDAGQINSGDRTLNRSVFGNIIYSANKNTDIGFELSHWRTEYYGHGDADAIRAQTSLMYKF